MAEVGTFELDCSCDISDPTAIFNNNGSSQFYREVELLIAHCFCESA